MIDLTRGNVKTTILRFTVPMFLGYVFQQAYNVVDMVVLGRFLGKEALSASGASFPMLFLWLSIARGIAFSFTIIVAHLWGSGKRDSLPGVIYTAMFTSVFLGLMIIAVGVGTEQWTFRLLSLPADVFPYAIEYYEVMMYGTVFVFGYYSLVAIMRGMGDSRVPFYLGLASNILNAGMDVLFVKDLGMGIWGVALATDLSFLIVFFVSIIILSRRTIRLGIKPDFSLDMTVVRKVIHLGLPGAGQNSVVAIGLVLFFFLVNHFGTDTIAAYTAASRVGMLALSPALILSRALTAFTGQNFSSRNMQRGLVGLKNVMLLGTLMAGMFFFVFYFFAPQVMEIFSSSPMVIKIGSTYLGVVAWFYVFFYLMQAFIGFVKGLGNTRLPMRITWVYIFLIQLPVAYFLAFRPFTLEPVSSRALWFAEPVAWLAGFMLSVIHFFKICPKSVFFNQNINTKQNDCEPKR